MGKNYYFRKKSVDVAHIEKIVDSLNNSFRDLVAKHNEDLREALTAMELCGAFEFDDSNTFMSPGNRYTYGDIHVAKLSCRWKPLLQANEHFHSVQTLKQWYEQNKFDYTFIDEYDEAAQFDDFLRDIAERNQNDDNKGHNYSKDTDGFEWTHMKFS